jgi:tetratricopeptide (TPR) repeat protein
MKEIAAVLGLLAAFAPAAHAQEAYVDWSTNATAYRGRTNRVTYICPPNGSPTAVVWGTDLYTDDSSVCKAAVHAGLITFSSGGRVTFEPRAGAPSYSSSTRNGVTTSSYGSWNGSFVFVLDLPAPITAPEASPSATTAGDPVELFGKGQEAFEDERFDDCIRLLTQVLSARPNDHAALVTRGACYIRKGQDARGLDDTERSLAIKPSPEAYVNRSIVHFLKGRQEAALADADRGLQLNPSSWRGYSVRASINHALARFDQALADANSAIRIVPRRPDLYLDRGDVYFAMKKYDLAEADYRKALSLTQTYDDAEFRLDRLRVFAGPCLPTGILAPQKKAKIGEKILLAATLGDGVALDDMVTWSSTGGKLITKDGVAVLDTSTVATPGIYTVTAEGSLAARSDCRQKSFAAATVEILPADPKPFATYPAPLTEESSALLISELKRLLDLIKAGGSPPIELRFVPRPALTPRQAAADLAVIKATIDAAGINPTAFRIATAKPDENSRIEIWASTMSNPAPRRGRR